MITETKKTTPNQEQPKSNTCSFMDKKTRAQYKADSKKVIINCLKIGAVVAFIMLTLTIVSADYSKIHEIFYVSFIASFVSYIILKNIQHTKYKSTFARYNHKNYENRTPSESIGEIWSSSLDLDSTMPGSGAYSLRQTSDSLIQQTNDRIIHG